MAELDRLLGFMSSWDRQAALKKYRALFAASDDEQALMDELGTPTKVAIELASSYVPTRPPSALAQALQECPVALDDLLRDPGALAADLNELPSEDESELKPETWIFDMVEPEPETDAVPAVPTRLRLQTGALIAYLIPAIVIGLPIALLLVCIGLPFLAAGAGLIVTAVQQALSFFAQLRLISDMLLTLGAMLVACGVGLALCWFGLWLSMELCWLWVGKALIGLGRRLCMREEAAP